MKKLVIASLLTLTACNATSNNAMRPASSPISGAAASGLLENAGPLIGGIGGGSRSGAIVGAAAGVAVSAASATAASQEEAAETPTCPYGSYEKKGKVHCHRNPGQ